MATLSHRLIAVNSSPAMMAVLGSLQGELAIEIVLVDTEVELLESLKTEVRLVALGLHAPKVPLSTAIRLIADSPCRPPAVLIGEVDAKHLQSVRHLATDLGVKTVRTADPLDGGLESPAALGNAVRSLITPDSAALRRALDEQQLALHYQPKFVSGDSRWIAGVEALVRWNHPDLGLLPPDRFLPLAEAAGLLADVTDFTITEAIHQHALWRDRGMDVPVAVNLAPELIKDVGFSDRLVGSLRQFDVEPSRLTIEVKETDRLADRALCLDAFSRLRLAGVGLALDDYGAGRSSLTELYRMPFTEVKIDGSLVADASGTKDARIVLRTIVRLAHELRMVVTAEGVETREQLGGVTAAGCDLSQGTLLCGPRHPADLEAVLAGARAFTATASKRSDRQPVAAVSAERRVAYA
jgi:EAL domain-containing protein (putative c-di-GMP-specific phosphodiesterase class I)